MASDRLRRGAFAVLIILGVITKLHALLECHCTNGCDVHFRCTSRGHCAAGWAGPTCQKENIALKRPTDQSSTVNDCHWAGNKHQKDICGDKTPSLAVNGWTSSDYWSGTCTHTVPGQTPVWWSVDLGQDHLVNSIRMYFSNPDRMTGFQIKVGSTRCYEWLKNFQPTSPLSINCDTPMFGRNVTIQLPGRTILNLCEVEIYECSDGWFGELCRQSCNCRNVGDICNKINGHCNSGCAVGYTGIGCQDECIDGWFGHRCSQSCNCLNLSETCNKFIGHCNSGCAVGYTGTGCNIENIAFNKTTNQSSTENDCKWATGEHEDDPCGDKTASLAVDGRRSNDYWSGTCTHTVYGQRSVWWSVDLKQAYLVRKIRLYFPNPKRMLYISIEVDSNVCYERNNSSGLSSPVTITCGRPVSGRNVSISLTRNQSGDHILNLCEVEIYGDCRSGSFGQECRQSCNCGNVSEICNKTTGHCYSGCAPGYTGTGCQDECDEDQFGANCLSLCYCKSESEVCDKVTGHCISGCKNGYTGPGCQFSCLDGQFGSECSETCGHCSGGNQKCDPVNGNCTEGCENHWMKHLCKDCEDGWFGLECDQECKCKDIYEICHKTTGQCMLSGCEDGWTGLDCYTECDSGTYGFNCSGTCGRCLRGAACGKIEGACTTGCEAGFTKPLCQECSEGYYGLDCESCGQCTGNISCNRDTGRCQEGCLPGWKGERCQQECENGTYGNNCSLTCGQCLGGAPCGKIEGECKGCNEGFSTPLCQECDDGYYGINCSMRCGQCWNNITCDKDSGQCSVGCLSGWKGQKCLERCEEGSYGLNCSNQCGRCVGQCDPVAGNCGKEGCKDGWTGQKCDKECPNGTYGVRCSQHCGQCLSDGVCHKETGHCPRSQCERGWKGLQCKEECENGTYGNNCSLTCGQCLGGAPCGKIEGECKECDEGFSTPLCQECEDGYYSHNCSVTCGRCLGGATCGKVDGECTGGCEDRFSPPLCQECEDGYYSHNCSLTCGRCLRGATCGKEDGECIGGCEDGFSPPLCQECDDGYYDINCSMRCGQCWNNISCDKDSGQCPGGCLSGWKGQKCLQRCEEGSYGLNCSHQCGRCVGQCDPVDGSCDKEGCKEGWTGKKCDKQCPNGTYGVRCSQPCGQCLSDGVCHKETGHCPRSQCERGWKGRQCNEGCNGTETYGYNCNETCGWCLGKGCDAVTGHCPEGCTPMYEGVACQLKKRSTSDALTSAGMGVLYSLIAILVVGLLVAIYFLKRRQQKTTNEEPLAMTSPLVNNNAAFNQGAGPSASSASASARRDDDDTYMNVESTKVKVSELRQYITRRTDKFEFEYGRLPKGLQYPHSVAANLVHKGKNRFKAIYPYDHSRVVLQETPGIKHSDYINASYIDTYNEKKVYIAAQGPNPMTVGDFWRMVWQEKSPIIVMLTRLAEGIKIKCEQYWPDEDKPMIRGDLQITNEGCVQKADFVIRELTVHNTKLDQKHQVTLIHYVTWPDHDVPAAAALVRFWKVFRSMAALNKKPFIVHCSAGVGRTGTFIALDVLMGRARDVGVVDVFDYVTKMREDRVSMVQTKEQYLFLHQVILEAFYSDTTNMTPTTFETLFTADTLGSSSEHSALQKQWKNLQQLNRVLHDKEVTASLFPENIRKTRVKDILPADKYRPILSLPVPGTNDYINAVFVPSDSREKGLVVTQLPLPWTVVDFWRLVIDHNVPTVVTLDHNMSGTQADDEAQFWPHSNTEMNCGPFVVSKIETKSKQTTSVSLQVWQKESAESTKHDVQLLYMSDWPESKDTPTQTSDFLHLVNEVNMLEKTDSGPVAVMCRDGATRCGLFCAVFNIIQRLKADSDIDIYLIIRQLQTIRPSFIPSYAQFQFCYQMVGEFQKTVTSVYENFQA